MLTNSPEIHQTNLFGSGLLFQLDPTDPLIKLSSVIPWTDLDKAFAGHYSKDTGAPSKPIRLMVGLLLLKQLENISEKNIILPWK